MVVFKGFMHRWYSVITQMVPDIAAKVRPILKTSTEAAIKQCTGGAFGRQCGLRWETGEYEGKTSAGREMNVLAAVASQLIDSAMAPVTNDTGGISKGNPNAGSGEDDDFSQLKPVTTADRAGAGVLTVFVLGAATATFAWLILD